MLRFALLVLLAGVVALSGCQVSTKPRTVVAVTHQEAPRVRRAPFDGQYQLFASRLRSGWAKPAGEPLATHRLRRGDTVGFRVDGGRGGKLRAVAGAESVPLERGRYLWEMRADAGQVDGTRTAALVVTVIGTVALISAIAATPF